jgi:hypothetical protein
MVAAAGSREPAARVPSKSATTSSGDGADASRSSAAAISAGVDARRPDASVPSSTALDALAAASLRA